MYLSRFHSRVQCAMLSQGYPTTSIPYISEICRKYSNFKGSIPLKFTRKSLSSKHFRTLFPEILVVRCDPFINNDEVTIIHISQYEK